MLDKLQAVANHYEELCARSEQPDFYNDPKKAAAILRERNDLEPIIEAFRAYNQAQQDMDDAQELMSDPEMKELCQQTFQEAKAEKAKKAANATTEAGRVGDRPYARGRAYKADRYDDQ